MQTPSLTHLTSLPSRLRLAAAASRRTVRANRLRARHLLARVSLAPRQQLRRSAVLTRHGLRVSMADWRRFGGERYRVFHTLALSQAVIAALISLDLVVTLLIGLGVPAPLTALLGSLPFIGGLAQLGFPRLLKASGGRLRWLTIWAVGLGETKGFWYAAIAAGLATGLLPVAVGVILLTIALAVGGVFGNVVGANLGAWYHIILPEPERRFVAPRTAGLTIAASTVLLVPIAGLIDHLHAAFGLWAYVGLFAGAGLAGLVELWAVRRLPSPGRVGVPAAAAVRATTAPEIGRFLRVIGLSSFGGGFGPFLGIYAMTVLGASAGFAILLGAVSSAAGLVTATAVGSFLGRGSSSRLLRATFYVRAGAMLVALAAFPLNPFAPVLLLGVAALSSVGTTAGGMAANERLFRIATGPAAIIHQGRYLATSAGAFTAGSAGGALIMALGAPFGFVPWALLMVGSAAPRLVAGRLAEASPSWFSAPATSPDPAR